MLYKKLLTLAAVVLFGASAFAAPAPDFSLHSDNTDSHITLSALKGQVVFLDFFASWCPPCRQSIPAVEAFYEKNKGKITVIGVNAAESKSTVADFIKKQNIAYPVVIADKDIADAFAISAIPAFFIIDKQGNIAKMYKGFAPGMEKQWQKEIDALLNAK